jgi:hypothetical protein
MAIFIVNFTSDSTQNAQVAAAIRAQFPLDHISISSLAMAVSFAGTAEELSKRLQISEGASHGGVVTQVSSYFGRANPALWTFFQAKLGA